MSEIVDAIENLVQGNPTLEVDIVLDSGATGRLLSHQDITGVNEALELRDGHKNDI